MAFDVDELALAVPMLLVSYAGSPNEFLQGIGAEFASIPFRLELVAEVIGVPVYADNFLLFW